MSDTPDLGHEERSARLLELIQAFNAQLSAVQTAERELDRRRSEVRRVAELQAADIINDARREVGQVLARARRELVALNARLEAAGCGAADQPGSMGPGVAQGDAVPVPTSAGSGVHPAGRRVHEVLDAARTELDSLTDQARQLRSPIAEGRPERGVGLPAVVPVLHQPRVEPHREDESATPAWQNVAPTRPNMTVAVVVGVLAVGSLGAAWIARHNASAPPAAVLAEAPEAAHTPPPPEPEPAGKAEPAPAATTGEGPGTGPVPRDLPVSLRLEFRRPVWLRATVDGVADAGRTYAAGHVRRVEGRREVSIRAGDAGAVWISTGGRSLAPLGRDGEVLTRRFTPGDEAPRRTASSDTDIAPGRPQPTPPPASSPSTPAPPAVGPPASGAATLPPSGRDDPLPAAASPAATAPADAASSVEREILARDQRWFDAHYAGDPIGMAAVSADRFTLEDTRRASERFEAVGVPVARTLEAVQLSSSGIGVVLSARMRERATIDGQERESVTMLTEVWVRRDDGWRLMGVRIATPPPNRQAAEAVR